MPSILIEFAEEIFDYGISDEGFELLKKVLKESHYEVIDGAVTKINDSWYIDKTPWYRDISKQEQ